MNKLGNLVTDRWVEGGGDGRILASAVTGEPVAAITSDGIDFREVLAYAKTVGGPNLRRLTFHQRGDMLKSLAIYLNGMTPIDCMIKLQEWKKWIEE